MKKVMQQEVKVIMNVSMGYFSVARHTGGCTYQGKEFIYIPPEDALIRRDLIKEYNKAKKEGKTFTEFTELLS